MRISPIFVPASLVATLLVLFICITDHARADGLYVTSTGNVGIGTSSPGNYKLNVFGWLGINGSTLDILAGANNAGIMLESTTLNQYDQFIRFKDPLGSWYVGQRWQSSSTNDFGIGTTADKNNLILTATGKVGIGVSPAQALDVNGYIRSSGIASAGQYLCSNSSGDIYVCATSSKRYKENIRSFTDGLSVVQKLRPVSFTWKKDSGKGDGDDVGLLAEDVDRVDSALAFTNAKGMIEGAQYNKIAAYLVSAVQEQQRQIEKLREEIRILRKRGSSR